MNGPILRVDDLASRWGLSRETVMREWRSGMIPPPFNSHQTRGFRWHVDVIAAHEKGETVAPYGTEQVAS